MPLILGSIIHSRLKRAPNKDFGSFSLNTNPKRAVFRGPSLIKRTLFTVDSLATGYVEVHANDFVVLYMVQKVKNVVSLIMV